MAVIDGIVTGRTDGSTVSEPLESTLIALSTLSLLELRLARLEHGITGTSDPISLEINHRPNDTEDVSTRLRTLEKRLGELKKLDGQPGSLVRTVDGLRKEYPDLFSDSSTYSTSDQEESARKRDLPNRATQVLSHAPLYTATSSRLQTVQNLKVPPASQSGKLIDAKPRIEELKKRQEKISADVEDLNTRSEAILRWWAQNGVTGMSEIFGDWESRVMEAARIVRHNERRRAEAGGYST